VLAELESAPYLPGKRAMLKVKHVRSADCVVAGFRWYKDREDQLGSLLLGLYDEAGVLQHVGKPVRPDKPVRECTYGQREWIPAQSPDDDCFRRKQFAAWSFTIPTACIHA
jgi:ATP-dependent DNA ligase